MPNTNPPCPKRRRVARLPELPKDALMKIVQSLMPPNDLRDKWIGKQIIEDVLPFACASRACCEAVLAVFDAYDTVFFDNGLHYHIHKHHHHYDEEGMTHPRTTAHDYLQRYTSDNILYRAAVCAFDVLCSNNPNYEPVLLYPKDMPKNHSRCCCCSTSCYILGLLKFGSHTLSIGDDSQIYVRRRSGDNASHEVMGDDSEYFNGYFQWYVEGDMHRERRLNLCGYSTCLVKAEVFVLKKKAVESLRILGLSQYPQHITRKMLINLFESCVNTLKSLVIIDSSAAVILAFCDVSRKFRRLHRLEIQTNRSEELMKTRLCKLLSTLEMGNVPVQELVISHEHSLSNLCFPELPDSLAHLYLSSEIFSLPKKLHSKSLRVLTIQCVRFDLSELLRLTECRKLPKLEEVRICYQTGSFKSMRENATPEELVLLHRVSRIHAGFHTFARMHPLPSSEELDLKAFLTYKSGFTELQELSATLRMNQISQFASYLGTLRNLTKLRLTGTMNFHKSNFCFDSRDVVESSFLFDALRCSDAPLRTLELNGVYSTKDTYRTMIHNFRNSLVRLQMMMHSPWCAPSLWGLVGVEASCMDVVEVLWGAVNEGTRLQYIGFGFKFGVEKRNPFDRAAVMEAFWSVQERMMERGVVDFSSDCILGDEASPNGSLTST